MEAPHLLPMESTVKVDGQLVRITNGGRQNAKAWFAYSRADRADASMALAEVPMKYVGLKSSIDLVKEYLIQWSGDFCAIFGFSQGATFCHILSMMAAAARRDGVDPDTRSFAKIQCAILLSGFQSMHHDELCANNPVTCSSDGDEEPVLALKSLHIFGERDTSVPKGYGLKLAGCFANPMTYDHGKGHVIPSNADFCLKIISFLDGVHNEDCNSTSRTEAIT